EELATRHLRTDLGEDRLHHLRLDREHDDLALRDERCIVGRAPNAVGARESRQLTRLGVTRPKISRLQLLRREQALGERSRHVAGTDESDLLPGLSHAFLSRETNRAVPMRISVAPSSIAPSKSSLIPIDSSLSRPASACRS